MLPVARTLRADPGFDARICVTAQHRQMLDQVLDLFEVKPDYDLDIMTRAQGLTGITTAVLTRLEPVLAEAAPDWVLVHGDTTTTMAATLAAFYQKVPVGHVEAGLRSGNMLQPWPEEMNRRVTDVDRRRPSSPRPRARGRTSRARTSPDRPHPRHRQHRGRRAPRGGRDDRHAARRSRPSSTRASPSSIPTGRSCSSPATAARISARPSSSLCEAIADLVRAHPIQVVYPVHLNPNVQEPVKAVLGGVDHVHLIEPLDYLPFVHLMQKSHVILTDSGGIQEEAPSLGKPVFVMRNVTERPEAVEAGTVRLVGTDRDAHLRGGLRGARPTPPPMTA